MEANQRADGNGRRCSRSSDGEARGQQEQWSGQEGGVGTQTNGGSSSLAPRHHSISRLSPSSVYVALACSLSSSLARINCNQTNCNTALAICFWRSRVRVEPAIAKATASRAAFAFTVISRRSNCAGIRNS